MSSIFIVDKDGHILCAIKWQGWPFVFCLTLHGDALGSGRAARGRHGMTTSAADGNSICRSGWWQVVTFFLLKTSQPYCLYTIHALHVFRVSKGGECLTDFVSQTMFITAEEYVKCRVTGDDVKGHVAMRVFQWAMMEDVMGGWCNIICRPTENDFETFWLLGTRLNPWAGSV